MAKRFTDTTKWDSPKFRSLPADLKLLLFYLSDRCDSAGVFEFDAPLASFMIGLPVTEASLGALSDHVERLPCGKWRILPFIELQYGTVDAAARPHRPVVQSIERHHLPVFIKNYSGTVPEGYPYPIHRVKDKDRDRNQDRDMDKEKDQEEDKEKAQDKEEDQSQAQAQATQRDRTPFTPPPSEDSSRYVARPTLEQARVEATLIGIPPAEAAQWWNSRESTGWTKSNGVGGQTTVGLNWRADLQSYLHYSRRHPPQQPQPKRYSGPPPRRAVFTGITQL